MKLVKAAGAIALSCISANAANMIQEEVQVAGEGNIIDWDAKVVTATERKRNAGERRELPTTGRSLKSPKTPKSFKASKSSPSPTSSPLIEGWNAADGVVYEALDATNVVDLTMSDEYVTINFDSFTYNWFGIQLSEINLSRYGYFSMRGRDEELGSIYFFNANLDTSQGGSVKYLKKKPKSSPPSLKISFEDVKFGGGVGNVQAQVELFPNGDILICYGHGDTAGNIFLTAIQEYTTDSAYLIQDDPFNGGGNASVWPGGKCWRFKMP